jgi:hypothetical protein
LKHNKRGKKGISTWFEWWETIYEDALRLPSQKKSENSRSGQSEQLPNNFLLVNVFENCDKYFNDKLFF